MKRIEKSGKSQALRRTDILRGFIEKSELEKSCVHGKNIRIVGLKTLKSFREAFFENTEEVFWVPQKTFDVNFKNAFRNYYQCEECKVAKKESLFMRERCESVHIEMRYQPHTNIR